MPVIRRPKVPVVRRSKPGPVAAMLAVALGAAALGALAIGALAIGRLAIGRLAIRKARFGALEVDELTVRRLNVLEREWTRLGQSQPARRKAT